MLEIKQEFVKNLVILELKGFLNTQTELNVFNQAIESLEDAGKTSVILEISEIPWMNSMGLGNIIAAMSSLRNRGGELKIANPTPKVKMLINMTSLHLIIETYDTLRSAVDSFIPNKAV